MHQKFASILFILCISAFGCTVSDENPRVQAIITPTRAMLNTPHELSTVAEVTITPSAALSTQTPTKTQLPSSTPPPSATLTIAPVSTLTSELAEQMLDSLLKDNGGFPQFWFWGIVPGQTTFSEARNIFEKLRYPLQLGARENGKEYYYSRLDYQGILNIDPAIVVRDGDIQSVFVSVTFREEIAWSQIWPAFSSKTLINQLGKPSEVRFRLEYPHEAGYPSDIAWYDMVMYFEDVNLIILYHRAPVKGNEQVIRICPPKDAFWSGRIWSGEDPENPPYPGIRLSDVSNITLYEFRDLLLGEEDQACLDLNVKAFYP